MMRRAVPLAFHGMAPMPCHVYVRHHAVHPPALALRLMHGAVRDDEGVVATCRAALAHVCYLSRLRRFQLLLYISLANQEQDSVAALATQAHARSEQ